MAHLTSLVVNVEIRRANLTPALPAAIAELERGRHKAIGRKLVRSALVALLDEIARLAVWPIVAF